MLAITSASAEKVSLHYYQNLEMFDIFINCNRVVTRWQYTFAHKKKLQCFVVNVEPYKSRRYWKCFITREVL